MTLRSAVFTGSAGAAWPALNNGDTWGALFTASPSIDPLTIASGPTSTLSGAGLGQISATHNLVVSKNSGGGVYTTTASTAGRYTFASFYPTSGAATVNLIFVTTSWTAAHYHQVAAAACTGDWLNQTYTLVTSTSYTSGANFYTLSVFRCVASASTSGNIAVDVYDTATSSIIATQATGGTAQVVHLRGVDQTSNGANAVRAANTTTASGSTGQPAVTLPNNLQRYSSLPIMFASHAQNTAMTSNSSDAELLSSGSYGTPGNGVVAVSGLAVAPNNKTARTMTANYTSATTPWAAIGLEILDSSTSDTYTAQRDYVFVRIANSTVQPEYGSAEVRTVHGANGVYGPQQGVVGKYVESGGTKYWLGTALTVNEFGKGLAYIYESVDNTTSTTFSTVAATTGNNPTNILTACAFRVRQLSSGNLWVSAKWWVNGYAEPAWPVDETVAGSSANAGNNSYAIANGIYSANTPLRTTSTGRVGVYYDYTPAVTFSNGVWYSSPDGATSTVWSSFTNDAYVTTGSAALTGTGSAAGTAVAVVSATASLSGTGSLSGQATKVILATADLSGSGSAASSAILIGNVSASLSGQGSVAATGVTVVVGLAGLSGAGQASGAGYVLTDALAALQGASGLSGVAEVNTAVEGTAALTGNGNMSVVGQAEPPMPLEVRLTYTVKVGTGLVSTSAIGTGVTSSTKVGTGITSTIIKET